MTPVEHDLFQGLIVSIGLEESYCEMWCNNIRGKGNAISFSLNQCLTNLATWAVLVHVSRDTVC